jgi:hypothetical protein
MLRVQAVRGARGRCYNRGISVRQWQIGSYVGVCFPDNWLREPVFFGRTGWLAWLSETGCLTWLSSDKISNPRLQAGAALKRAEDQKTLSVRIDVRTDE